MPDVTLYEVIRERAEAHPDAPALLTTTGHVLAYRELVAKIDRVRGQLAALGIGRNDRVAVVLPNGIEMATTFLATISGCTCAPLNPSYRASEFEFYLSDLRAKCLIVQDESSPAVEVAKKLGIQIVVLRPTPGPDVFELVGCSEPAARAPAAEPDDVALVLHTSGTTARPKIVPLSQRNLLASARNIGKTLQLVPGDRCLIVMPLFHIHGLVGCLLSSLAAGASLICAGPFTAANIVEWLKSLQATWYSAVPTIHQAVLEAANAAPEVARAAKLRFIRSSSSALPPPVATALEKVFSVPVIEAYGMTEASHQMASNPLPPRPRKLGSVGPAAGPEVLVVDPQGQPVPPNTAGDIVIKGPSVITGYENNPDANRSSFLNGYLRTGDEGHLDEDGYLFLTGRTKEMINRAGEKVAPREVDDVLLQHEAVAQAVTFAVKHATLGEDVAAAVVLRPGATAGVRELRVFAQARLAAFKVPQQIVVVDQIPKGATGKVQRIGLADKLAEKLRANYVAPRDALEEAFALLWGQALKQERVGVTDNYFAIGGDSMNAAIIVSRAQRLGVASELIFLHPTIAEIVAAHREAVEPDVFQESLASAVELVSELEAPSPEQTDPKPDKEKKPGFLKRLWGGS